MTDYESDSSISFPQNLLNTPSPQIHYFSDEDDEFLTQFSELNDEEYERQCRDAETQFHDEGKFVSLVGLIIILFDFTIFSYVLTVLLFQLNNSRKELNDDERILAYSMLLQQSNNGKLNRSVITKEVAIRFGVSTRTIQRLWKRGKESANHNISKMRVMNCGRKRVEIDLQKVRRIPLRKRTTLRYLAQALGVSTTVLFKKLKSNELKRHSNYIHPSLTEGNRFRRIEHCLSMIDPATVGTNPTFLEMDNVVHIDEKWFSMTRKIQTYYLLANKEAPVRTCRSTNFIPKIMFLAAVARPRYDSEGNCTFDGKIGVFAMVEEAPAIRSSVNRVVGTLEVKVIPKISRDVIRRFMISKILPAIKEKWPRDSITKPILIQQDNTKTHIYDDDVDFLLAVQNSGLNVKILCQPPNSPDLNVLDLGFFRAIQSLQEKECANSVVQLIAAVEKSFNEFSCKKSNYIFITLQSCMIEVLRTLGSNTYKIPHLQKDQLERLGSLPSRLPCDSIFIEAAIAHLPQ